MLEMRDRALSRMRLQPVESSSIEAIGYEARTSRLLVQFRASSDVYAYYPVPPHVFRELEEADSKGRYVNYKIKEHYRYERLTQP